MAATPENWPRGPGFADAAVTATAAAVLADLAALALLDHAGGGDGDVLLAGAYQDTHIATGMRAAQPDISVTDASARLRAHAFAQGRPLLAVAQDMLDRRLRLDALVE